jgi:hypothetical protein
LQPRLLEWKYTLCTISNSQIEIERMSPDLDKFKTTRNFSKVSSAGVTFVLIKSNGHVDRHSNGIRKVFTVQLLYENRETVVLVAEKPKIL